MAVTDPDLALVKRVAAGDAAAARALVEAHGDRLMAVAYRMLASREAAEEVVQEAFLRMWRHAAKWQPGKAQFSTWLHRVAINLCYDRLRKASSKYEYAAGDALPEMADEAAGADDELERGERAFALHEALARLPARQKMAVVLCHFEEHSNREAAEMMEVSLEALESLLARARRALKADMQLQEALSAETDSVIEGV